jgi:ribosome maturation factor RimP
MVNLEIRTREILQDLLEQKSSYLVDLKVVQGQLVQVFVDRDPHITIEDCAWISRGLEKELNREFPFSDQYVLEVSSPGMDQPLKVLRQYKKCVGREVAVVLTSGVKKSGRLLYADEEKILLEETKDSKQREPRANQTEIPFLNIKSTGLVIKF